MTTSEENSMYQPIVLIFGSSVAGTQTSQRYETERAEFPFIDFTKLTNMNWHILTDLDMSNNKLLCVPDQFADLHLSKLNLSHNLLNSVPNFLNIKASRIHCLDLSYNYIKECEKLNCWWSLIIFKLNNNLLTTVPSWLWESKVRLVELDISCNPIDLRNYGIMYKTFESTSRLRKFSLANCNMGNSNCKILEEIPNLKYMDIGNRNDKEVPYCNSWDIPMGSLHCKSNLRELHANNLYLTVIPETICELSGLKELHLSNNDIHWLPESFTLLKHLEICFLNINRIIYLPKTVFKMSSLKELHLMSNLLTQLPETMTELESLCTLDLYDNLLEQIDPELINRLDLIDIEQNYIKDRNFDRIQDKTVRLRTTLGLNETRIYGFKPLPNDSVRTDACEDDDHQNPSYESSEESVVDAFEPPAEYGVHIEDTENWDSADDNNYEPTYSFIPEICNVYPPVNDNKEHFLDLRNEIFKDAD